MSLGTPSYLLLTSTSPLLINWPWRKFSGRGKLLNLVTKDFRKLSINGIKLHNQTFAILPRVVVSYSVVFAFVVIFVFLKLSSTAWSHLSSCSSCIKCWSLCRSLDGLVRVKDYLWNCFIWVIVCAGLWHRFDTPQREFPCASIYYLQYYVSTVCLC